MAKSLVTYKQPRSYEFVSFALRDDAGKVRRTQLRDERIAARKE
jgi:bile acid-coenzyme A ligase